MENQTAHITDPPATNAIFPLMMTPFEYYMWTDHRPEYPMVVVGRLDFDGEIDRDAFENAVREMAERHPLTRCIVDPTTEPLPTWKLTNGQFPEIHWEEMESFEAFSDREDLIPIWIDLSQEPGLKFRVLRGGGRSAILFYMHHSVSDGLGLFQMLGDLLAIYARRFGDEIAIPELEPDLLPLRKILPKTARKRQRGLRAILRRINSFLRWVIIPAAPLTAPSEKSIRQRRKAESRKFPSENRSKNLSGDDSPKCSNEQLAAIWSPIRAIRLPVEEVVRLRNLAKSQGTTLNVLLMRDLTVTLAQWNMERGPRAGKSYWLRIGLPVSIRSQVHEQMPAVNVVSYLFPVRWLCGKTLDRDKLLASLNQEVSEMFTGQRAFYFARILNRTQNHPGIIRHFVHSKTCFATAIHSYLGDFPRRFEREFPTDDDGRSRIGNLRFEGILSTPPVRARTSVAAAYHQYRGAMDIGIRFDPHRFTEEDAAAFTEMFLGKIRANFSE